MAITVVQTASGAALPISFASPVTAGNTVIVVVDMIPAGTPVLAAPKLGGSSVAGAYPIWNDSGTTNAVYLSSPAAATSVWVLPNVPAANGIDFGTNNVSANVGTIAYEVSGLGAAPIINVSAEKNGSLSTTLSVTSPTVTVAPAFIIGAAATYNGASAGAAGFTCVGPGTHGWAGYIIAPTAGSSYTWAQDSSEDSGWTAGVAAIVAGVTGSPVAAAFTSSGSLAATVAPKAAAAAALSGNGALTATTAAAPHLDVAAALSTAGALHATIRPADHLDPYPDAVHTLTPENVTVTINAEPVTATVKPEDTVAAIESDNRSVTV